jgi:hypothetical protein
MTQNRSHPAPSRNQNTPFGMLGFLDWNHDWNSYLYNTPEKLEQAIQMIGEAGSSFVRQVISWDEVEKRPGQFDFAKYDDLLDRLERHGLKTLAILCYTATWTGKAWNSVPDADLFLKYVEKTVERYKGRIAYWEVWNEPDHPTYWKDQDGEKAYVALLKRVYAAIKRIDPSAQVVLGSVCAPPALREMYQHGAKDYFDVANVHPFTTPLQPGALDKVQSSYRGMKSVMGEFQDDKKPIWITELGCPGVPPAMQNPPDWWEGKSPTEEQQAAWLEQLYGKPLEWPGLEKIFWAFFQDTQHFHDGTDYFGLIGRDFKIKPAYHAYRAAARSWAAKRRK